MLLCIVPTCSGRAAAAVPAQPAIASRLNMSPTTPGRKARRCEPSPAPRPCALHVVRAQATRLCVARAPRRRADEACNDRQITQRAAAVDLALVQTVSILGRVHPMATSPAREAAWGSRCHPSGAAGLELVVCPCRQALRLYSAVRCDSRERQGLQRLRRCITHHYRLRPPAVHRYRGRTHSRQPLDKLPRRHLEDHRRERASPMHGPGLAPGAVHISS